MCLVVRCSGVIIKQSPLVTRHQPSAGSPGLGSWQREIGGSSSRQSSDVKHPLRFLFCSAAQLWPGPASAHLDEVPVARCLHDLGGDHAAGAPEQDQLQPEISRVPQFLQRYTFGEPLLWTRENWTQFSLLWRDFFLKLLQLQHFEWVHNTYKPTKSNIRWVQYCGTPSRYMLLPQASWGSARNMLTPIR